MFFWLFSVNEINSNNYWVIYFAHNKFLQYITNGIPTEFCPRKNLSFLT